MVSWRTATLLSVTLVLLLCLATWFGSNASSRGVSLTLRRRRQTRAIAPRPLAPRPPILRRHAAPSSGRNHSQINASRISHPFVAFVIPTVGRPSLTRAVESLLNQTRPDWRAILVADGVTAESLPRAAVQDARVTVLPIPLAPRPFPAAAVRNAAIPLLLQWQSATTQTNGHVATLTAPPPPLWVAFLDDDDVVLPQYVEWLMEASAASPDASAVVFRMALERRGRHLILPPPDTHRLCLGWVGISFALRVPVFQETPFRPSHTEDVALLQKLFWTGKTVLLSEHVAYRVREEPVPAPLPRGLSRVAIVLSNRTLAITCPRY